MVVPDRTQAHIETSAQGTPWTRHKLSVPIRAGESDLVARVQVVWELR